MIIVTGSATARPETFEALRAASLDHVHRSRAEDGCLFHSVQADCEDPLQLFFFEQWRDLAALHAHFERIETRAFVSSIRALAAVSEPIALYDATTLPVPG